MSSEPNTGKWTVSEADHGIRLDKFLALSGGVSRRIARIWISTSRVEVKGRAIRILTKPLRKGTVVVLRPGSAEGGSKASNPSGLPPIEILFADRDLLVVNKPANLLSESDRFGAPCLETVLARQLEKMGEPSNLWLVHRLDAGTSGVIVLGRTPRGARELSAAFREGRVKKTYLALAKGYLRKGSHIDGPIARVKGTKHGIKPGGKPSHTHVAPIESTKDATLVKAQPTTGRTHQIRVHMASIEMPLYGDRLYGGPGYTEGATPKPIGRAMLHAFRLVLPHPKSGEALEVEVPPPRDFIELAESLNLWNRSGVFSLDS